MIKETQDKYNNAIVQAFISYFYAQGLLTDEELLKLKNCLKKYHIRLDVITLKSDVCNGGTSQ